MALFTESYIKGLARPTYYTRTASKILREEFASDSKKSNFDVFLSHSIKDAEIILGVKRLLESELLSVYVDWIEDPQMDRSKVTTETAENLRKRMQQSKSLIYVHTINSPNSKWMPWELGYFDGFRGAVAVLPIVQAATNGFSGQEFLGLYPYLDGTPNNLWINQGKAPRSRIGTADPKHPFREARSWFTEKAGIK